MSEPLNHIANIQCTAPCNIYMKRDDCEEAKKDVPPEDLGTNQENQNGQVVENAASEEITES